MSSIVKLLKPILEDFLYYITESKHLFSRFQAGFQKRRSCEDQILRIFQTIQDRFQRKPIQRFALVLCDFRKAYVTV